MWWVRSPARRDGGELLDWNAALSGAAVPDAEGDAGLSERLRHSAGRFCSDNARGVWHFVGREKVGGR